MADNIKKFVDVTLLTKDIKKLAEFYEKIGFPKVVDNEGIQVFSVDNQDLAIHKKITEDPFGSINPDKPIIGYLVEDLDAIIERLKEHNIEYSGPRSAHLGFIAIRVKDPDGNHINFYQVPKGKNT